MIRLFCQKIKNRAGGRLPMRRRWRRVWRDESGSQRAGLLLVLLLGLGFVFFAAFVSGGGGLAGFWERLPLLGKGVLILFAGGAAYGMVQAGIWLAGSPEPTPDFPYVPPPPNRHRPEYESRLRNLIGRHIVEVRYGHRPEPVKIEIPENAISHRVSGGVQLVLDAPGPGTFLVEPDPDFPSLRLHDHGPLPAEVRFEEADDGQHWAPFLNRPVVRVDTQGWFTESHRFPQYVTLFFEGQEKLTLSACNFGVTDASGALVFVSCMFVEYQEVLFGGEGQSPTKRD